MRRRWSKEGAQFWCWDSVSNTKTAYAATSTAVADGDKVVTNFVGRLGNVDPFNLLVQFPAPINLTKIGLRANNNYAQTLEYSTDSTNGLDGTWTNAAPGTWAYPGAGIYKEHALNLAGVTWLRLRGMYWGTWVYCLHLFGDYVTNTYEFWSADGLTQLTADYPLAFAATTNGADSHQTLQFKIKNTDAVGHTYTLTPLAFKYGGDTFLDTELTMSLDGGTTKLASVTTANVAAGALSELITVCFDTLAANNPADDIHSFSIGTVVAT